MIQSPRSLTAIVHVKFHYGEGISKAPDESQIELLNNLMEKTSSLDPELQRILVGFADQMKATTGQSPR